VAAVVNAGQDLHKNCNCPHNYRTDVQDDAPTMALDLRHYLVREQRSVGALHVELAWRQALEKDSRHRLIFRLIPLAPVSTGPRVSHLLPNHNSHLQKRGFIKN
jgi:hypothetical protein